MQRVSALLASALLLLLLRLRPSAATDGGANASCFSADASAPGSCNAPVESGIRPAVGAPGLMLIQGRYVASIDVERKRKASSQLECAPFGDWPQVDNGVTCGNCRALVSTADHKQCDHYCQSFGHICVAAAEEEAETCVEKRSYSCNQKIPATSDMLCTCRRPYPGESVPTTPAPPATPAPVCGGGQSCDHCDEDEPRMHAGCLVVKDGRLLSLRITYGSKKFDTPGGQSNWKEPASCTAHRQTFEETGYEVTPTELLAGGIHGGGFNLYRCELLSPNPTKDPPDSEVSSVSWLTKEEVQERLDQDLWRYPEAKYYVKWMR